MINKIKEILKNKDVEWLVRKTNTISYELFFVDNELQMNRAKDVTKYSLTIYHHHNDFMGIATTSIYPTMDDKELNDTIDNCIYSASLTNNKPFKLAVPTNLKEVSIDSNLKEADKIKTALKIAETIFGVEKDENKSLNATEIFINEAHIELFNSNNIDYKAESNTANVEFISTYNGKKESVELYSYLELGNVDYEYIKNTVKEKLAFAKLRSEALPMISLDNIDVVFRPTEIKEILSYYLGQANVGSIYNKISNAKIGDDYQKDATCDKLTITVDPFIKSSVESCPFDNNGFSNEKVVIYKDGVIQNLHGSNQFGQYLNVVSKVNSNNVVLEKGTLDINKLDRYIEIISMSGIQVDDATGSFGGEIRLALLHDSNVVTPYFGGSIMGFLKDYSNKIYLSNEVVEDNTYNGPKYLLLKESKILGK